MNRLQVLVWLAPDRQAGLVSSPRPVWLLNRLAPSGCSCRDRVCGLTMMGRLATPILPLRDATLNRSPRRQRQDPQHLAG